ncbi:MAG: hypothetical protein ACOYMA_13630 [Bacteroidia bacterium]
MKISKQFIGKKFTIIICLALLGNMANAQYYFKYSALNNYDYYGNTGKMFENTDYKKLGVKEVITKNVEPKSNKVISTGINLVNAYGISYQFLNLNKKGILTYSNNYHFIDSVHYDKRLIVYKIDSSVMINVFNDKKLITEVQYFNKKKEKRSFAKHTYNENNKIASITWCNKKGAESYRYEYQYFENGSRKTTSEFDKGKLKKVYNYTCLPMGTVEKKVSQQNICKKRTYNPDSSYFEIFEGMDNKGKSSRKIIKYSKDSTAKEQVFYDNNDKETMEFVYEKGNNNSQKTYFYYKGKLKEVSASTKNKNGLIESYTVTNGNGKVKSNTTYEYNYF